MPVTSLHKNYKLFLNRQARIFPSVDAAIEMVDGLKIVFLKIFQRLSAAAAGGAVNEISFGFIQRTNTLLEIGAVEIDIGRSCDVERFEFLGGPNIEDDEVCFREQFLSAPGINVFDGRRSGNIGAISR